MHLTTASAVLVRQRACRHHISRSLHYLCVTIIVTIMSYSLISHKRTTMAYKTAGEGFEALTHAEGWARSAGLQGPGMSIQCAGRP